MCEYYATPRDVNNTALVKLLSIITVGYIAPNWGLDIFLYNP